MVPVSSAVAVLAGESGVLLGVWGEGRVDEVVGGESCNERYGSTMHENIAAKNTYDGLVVGGRCGDVAGLVAVAGVCRIRTGGAADGRRVAAVTHCRCGGHVVVRGAVGWSGVR